MKGQGETGKGGSKERGREREGEKEGRGKNKGVFTCLWNQQLAALSHNLRHMDVIRTPVSVCAGDWESVCARQHVFALRAGEDSHVFVVEQMTVVPNNLPHHNRPPSCVERGLSQSDTALKTPTL